MTKEELIELSDLNREDNIKYISSEAQGIAIALDSDRYAPTFCKLERAYICGRRKSEKRIEELAKENAELKRDKEDLIFIRNQNAKCMCEDKERLTKATEIIKKLCTNQDDYCIDCTCYKFLENMRAEAEQFLNSEVKK